MKHFLAGIEVSPRNLDSIGITSDFTDRPDILELDTDRIVLVREAVDIIDSHLGTYGPFEGIPYTVVALSGSVLEYYVDLQDNAIYRDNEIEIRIKRRLGKDNFFTRADSISFELMASKGVNFSTFNIPYVIIPEDAISQGLTLAVSIYVMAKEAIDQTVALSETITNIIDAVTLNATVPPSVNTGPIITLVIKALLQLAILALLLIALIKMVEQFFELIFPKVRNFLGTKFKTLCERGCQYLGYEFSSTLLDGISGLTHLGVPLVKEKKSFFDFIQNDLDFAFNKGYPSAGDSTPTLGSLFTMLETMFNAKTTIKNGVVHLEIRNYFQNLTTNILSPALNDQDKRQLAKSYNTEDIWKRYYIHYQTDYTDTFTVDFYDPTDAEYSTEAVLINNSDLVTIAGLNEVSIPFALGGRKDHLNWLEDFAKGFFEIVDDIINAFGGNGNYAAQIESRKGVLQVSNQFFGTTKMLYTIGGRQPSNYSDLIRASTIYNNYHKINEIQVNDYIVITDAPMRISTEDFLNLLENNYAYIDGDICEVLKINFKDEKSLALIDYKVPSNWADGKTTVITIND